MTFSAVPGEDEIELVYATGTQVFHWRGAHQPGLTVADVLRESGVLDRHPEIDFATFGIGVWGVIVKPSRIVQRADRVEIYPPLLIDPKTARRQRAAKAQQRA